MRFKQILPCSPSTGCQARTGAAGLRLSSSGGSAAAAAALLAPRCLSPPQPGKQPLRPPRGGRGPGLAGWPAGRLAFNSPPPHRQLPTGLWAAGCWRLFPGRLGAAAGRRRGRSRVCGAKPRLKSRGPQMSEGLRAADGALLWTVHFRRQCEAALGLRSRGIPGGALCPRGRGSAQPVTALAKAASCQEPFRCLSFVSGHIGRSRRSIREAAGGPLLLSSGAPEEGEHQAAPTLNQVILATHTEKFGKQPTSPENEPPPSS